MRTPVQNQRRNKKGSSKTSDDSGTVKGWSNLSQTIQSTISRELFSEVLSKSQKTQLAILDGVIQAYAQHPAESITFDTIAKCAGVSRALVVHYYPDRKELLLVTAKYVRAQFQEFVVEEMKRSLKEQSSESMLRVYAKSVYQWTFDRETLAYFWASVYQHCLFDPDFKQLNTELTVLGRERICGMLESVSQNQVAANLTPKSYIQEVPKQEKNSVRIEDSKFWDLAGLIQNLLTGTMISLLTVEMTQKQKKSMVELSLDCVEKLTGQSLELQISKQRIN